MKKTLICIFLLMIMISGCKGSINPNEQLQTTEQIQSTEQLQSTQQIQSTQEVIISESSDIQETVQFDFRTEELYESHYQKHKSEFGEITKEEYLEQANALINSQGDYILTKKSEDGDTLFFNTETNEFLVLSPDEQIRTYFIPDSGMSYYEKQ